MVVNFGDREETAEVSLDGMAGRDANLSFPFEKDRKCRLPVRLSIPPHRCAVVVGK